MVEEIRAIDLADAERDENLRMCDHCAQAGADFFDGNWLCEDCRSRMRQRLEVTR
jgi:hypothetical protein